MSRRWTTLCSLRRAVCAGSFLLVVACSSVACSSADSARPKPSAAPSPASLRSAEAKSAGQAPAAPAASAPAQAVTAAPTLPDAPAELPDRVDAGDIDRPLMLEVLASGIGRFLGRVRVQAERDAHGRFAGWRLEQLFPGEMVQPNVLRAGDTLLRVNGQSVERPEQLKTVWDSLVTSRELVLTVRRAGKQSEIRYRIVDASEPEPEAATPSKDASTGPLPTPTTPAAPSNRAPAASSATTHES